MEKIYIFKMFKVQFCTLNCINVSCTILIKILLQLSYKFKCKVL